MRSAASSIYRWFLSLLAFCLSGHIVSRLRTAIILLVCLVAVFGQASTAWGEPILQQTITAETAIPDISGIAAAPDSCSWISDSQGENYEIKPNNTIFILSWGSSGTGDGQFCHPSGIAVDSSDNVYVADTCNGRIQKFDSSGNFLAMWGQFFQPSGIAVDNSDNVYVADTGNNRIQKFDSNGQFLAEWGILGAGAGQFYNPSGIAVDSSSNVYVADTGNGRIQKFDSNGNFLDKWGTWVPIRHCYRDCGWWSSCHDICTDSWDPSPIALAVDTKGNVFVLHNPAYLFTEVASQVFKYDSNGRFLTRWGPPLSKIDQFPPRYTSGLAVDSLNNIYVTFKVHYVEAAANNLIEKLDGSGNLLKQWGSWGTGNGQFYNPGGIAVSGSGNVYVADTGNNRIQKFEQTFKIKGAVKKANGIPMTGVLMSLSGDANKTARTDSFGKFTFKNVSNGSYTVTPSKAGYDFTPAVTDITIYGNHAIGKNFTGATFSISGTVKKANGSPIAGVLMSLSGDASKTVTTDSNGSYKFNRVTNGNYTIVPDKAGFTFAPTSIALDISGASVKMQDFTGTRN